MIANELRVGNLVNTISRKGEVHLPNSTVFSVQEIGFDCILCNINKIPSQERTLPVFAVRDLCPIDLTEEWFRKCGGRIGGEQVLFIPMPKIKAELHFEMKPYGNVVVIKSDFGELVPEDIEYVHQLQNLYFALTGEELTIKEDTK